ncbi:hypothetical protein [Nocardia sp. NPDC048505]|uniref:hypothetical protein n=1 Tax=unclassified Nocardia TaxID=2637762 RepID=UPI003404800B
MSGVERRVELLSWPSEWRRDEQRNRVNVAKGDSGIRVVQVDVDGVVEQGLLVPFQRASRWVGVLFLVIGVAGMALVGVGAVRAVVYRDWRPVAGMVCIGLVAAFFLFIAYAVLAEDRSAATGLRLTPTRIVGPHFAIPWHEVQRIRPFVSDRGSGNWVNAGAWTNDFAVEVRDPEAVLPARVGRATRLLLQKTQGNAVLTVQDKQLAVHPLLAYHLVRHYFENPAERPGITRALS